MTDLSTTRKIELSPLGEPTPTATEQKPASKKEQPRPMPRWEADAREKVKAAIRKYSRPLADLVARDANEGDTRLIITDFLCDGLGFDKYADLTTEYSVKGEFADYGIRMDKQLLAFIEVKRVATRLDVKHLRQVEMYAVNEGVEWAILTNAVEWRVYHFTGGLPVQLDLAMQVNLLGEEPLQQKANSLFYLSRESFKRKLIDDLWRAKKATSPKSFALVISSEAVVDAIRRELKRQTGHSLETGDVRRLLKETVLRPECL